jgi:adiponectin receptor
MASSTSLFRKRTRRMKAHGTSKNLRDSKTLVDTSPLIQWHELPLWQQDNHFILSGYRPQSGSYCQSLESLKQVHNETVNIYSHLLGSVLFATLPIYMCSQVYPRCTCAHLGDFVVFSIFFFGIVVCFFFSATFHILASHSERVAAFSNHLDYLGIVTLMWGSTIPSIYYGFYDDSQLQRFYWSVVTILAALCIVATLDRRFQQPSLRQYRVAIYSGLGLSAIVFIIHGLAIHGWETQNHRMSLSWMGLMGILNLTGAIVYATRVPERWYPKRYDICGSSHQILHFMVIFAGLAHMIGLLSAFEYVHRA